MAEAMFANQYDWKLVALSVVVALCASYITSELAGRAAGKIQTLYRSSFWIAGAALSVGVGLWGIRLLQLLAFNSALPVTRSVPAAIFSLLTSFASSLVAMFLVCWQPLKKHYLFGVSLVSGGCVSAMLYVAAEGLTGAKQSSFPASFSNSLLSLALITSAAACLGVFLSSFRLPELAMKRSWTKLPAAAVMGLAIAAIQYAGISGPAHQLANLHAQNKVLMGDPYRVGSLIVVVVAALLLAVYGLSLFIAKTNGGLVERRMAVRNEQERNRLAMTTTQDGLFDFNLVTGEVFYSARWKEIIGHAPDELENTLETWQHRIHPNDRKDVDASVEEYLHSRQGTLEMEYRLRHRDGTWRWILSRSQAVWNNKGQAVRLVGSHCDISDRRRALDELSASEARFGAFMQHNPSIASIRDSEGKFIYTNPTLERVCKLTPNEWLGKSVSEIFPEAVAKRVAESDLEVLKATARLEMIEELELPDGSVHQFLTSKFTFPDASGKRAIGSVSIDITERILGEEKLRASEMRYKELFASNPLPSWIYRTRDMRILDVNQAAIDHYGWSREQFLNLTVRSLQLPGEDDSVEAERRQALQVNPGTRPVRHRRNKKSDIWVQLSCHEFEADGTQFRLVMANDVTEGTHQPARLESLTVQQTAALQTNDAKWRNLVEALPHIVWTARPDGFCDYISQRFSDYTGAPAAKLTGWGWLSLVHPQDRESVRTRWRAAVASSSEYEVEYRIRSKEGDYRWFITRGRAVDDPDRKGAVQWLGTTTDIEEQKRIQDQVGRRAELESADFSLESLLEESIDLTASSALAKDISLDLNVAEDVPCNVVGDAGRLQQILLILLSNAVRFTNRGSICLSVAKEESREASAELASLRFSIRDTGIGLTPEQQEVLFHPVMQHHQHTLDRPSEGTGLDLSTARQLVELMGGTIGVFSQVGAGSTFWFRVCLRAGSSLLPADLRLLTGRRVLLRTGHSELSQRLSRYMRRADLEVVEPPVLSTGAEPVTPDYLLSRIALVVTDTAALADSPLLHQVSRCPLLVLGSPAECALAGIGLRRDEVDFLDKAVRCLPFLRAIRGLLLRSNLENSSEDQPFKERLPNAKILLVEDNRINQLVAKLLLTQLGCQVTVVSNGLEACAAVEDRTFDLILMDCQMPEMDGFEATRAIREREVGTRHRTPIVALSAGVLKEERDRCYAAGMDDFLSKPLEKHELQTALDNWLHEHRSAAQAAGS